jgi:hypothetical protein
VTTNVSTRITRRYLAASLPTPAAAQRCVNQVSDVLDAFGPRPGFGFEVRALFSRQEVEARTLEADAVLAVWGRPPPLLWVVVTFDEGSFQADELADLEQRAGLRLYEEQRFPAR